jgi:hypothetical protein
MAADERTTGSALNDTVRAVLRKSRLPFVENVNVDGYLSDFVFVAPDGTRHIVETKAEAGITEADLKRARTLVKELRELPTEGAFVVVPKVGDERRESGVVTVDGLARLLKTLPAAKAAGRTTAPTGSSWPSPGAARGAPFGENSLAYRKTGFAKPPFVIFAAMPFAQEYDDAFLVAIKGAAKAAGGAAKRVDKDDYVGDIVGRIKERIRQARALVVDLSESRPNVLYEMGFAQASGRPVVPICSTPLDQLPFDVRNLNVLVYQRGQTAALKPKLTKRLKAAIAGKDD